MKGLIVNRVNAIRVCAPGRFDCPIQWTPIDNPFSVPKKDGVIYRLPASPDHITLTSHAMNEGRHFEGLLPGMTIKLTLEGGRQQKYMIRGSVVFYAVDRDDVLFVLGRYVDMLADAGKPLEECTLLTSRESGARAYNEYGRGCELIFYTCVVQQNIPDWGRRYVYAKRIEVEK